MIKLTSIYGDATIYIHTSSILALVAEKNLRLIEKYGEYVKVTTNIPHMISGFKSDIYTQSLTTTYSVKEPIEQIEMRISL